MHAHGVNAACACVAPYALPCVITPVLQGLVRLVVLAILLASAGAVTKLMAMNMQAARNVVWDDAAMDSRINIAMQVGEVCLLRWSLQVVPGQVRAAESMSALEWNIGRVPS